MNSHFVYFLLLFLLFPSMFSNRATLIINGQEDFDNISQQVLACIEDGKKDIRVEIARGTFTVKENSLSFKNINAPDVRLSIEGKGSILIPEGRNYCEGDHYIGPYDMNNSWMSADLDIETWSNVQYADGIIEFQDVSKKKCRIKSARPFPSDTDISNAFILIPHWYQSSVYGIDKIEGQYIYFTADNLKESSYGGYNINDDFNYGKKSIRYKLCNVETGDNYLRVIDGIVHLPKGVNSVREGRTNRFLSIHNCEFASIEVVGIHIRGNAQDGVNPAVCIKNSECKRIRIHKCGFYGMRGNVISIEASPNVLIDDNEFNNCYFCGIKSDNESDNTIVEKNSFTSMGKRMSSTPSVRCQGAGYRISGNRFYNFGYCGINTGVWYKSESKSVCRGVIENNDLSYSQDYIKDIDNFGIMDGGAIYIATKNEGTIIRYNFIHSISGMKSNRGIFLDDGAYNVEIYGNIILGIVNSRCIDSRRVARVESRITPESGIDRANVNVIIHDNIIDGDIRFEANESVDNGCVKGVNYILSFNNGNLPTNVIKGVANNEDDILLEFTGIKDERIIISSSSYRLLKQQPFWHFVRPFFVNSK